MTHKSVIGGVISGPYFPPNTWTPTRARSGGPRPRPRPSPETARRFPGAQEWAFSCIQQHTGVATDGPIQNPGPTIPSQWTIPQGWEGVVTFVQIGPNLIPTSGGNSWNAGVKFNGVPVPGWYPIGGLKATDGMGNWWADCDIPVPESTLITLVKFGDALGAGNPADIGGNVHGIMWPVMSRVYWEDSQLSHSGR